MLSDGRLDVGVGIGWMKDEYDIARSADWNRRGRMLDDRWRSCMSGGRPPRCPGTASSSPCRSRAVRHRTPAAILTR
nr:hypothetical protein [Mycobacterium sp.]